MSRSNLRSTILGFTLLSCLFSFDTAHGFNEDRIKVESNFIFVKYDHELKGEPTGYHQRIDISSFGQVTPKKYVDGDEFNLNWADFGTFRIKKKDDKCEDYELTSKRDQPLRVRFDTSNVFLYGGPEQDYQGWPVDYNKYDKYSYVSKEKDSQAVLESFWLFTNGMYLHVDEKTPLFITQDKSKGVFELIASREAPYIRSGGVTEMKYTICKLDNMKEAHKHAVSTKVIGKPSGLPDTKAVKFPIWSTWAMYLRKIDDQVIADYANLITQSKLPNSQLEIDDKWETCYGSLTVNRTTFPDMKELVARLHAKNFGVTMWVHPFVNTGCEPFFSEGVEKGYFVKNTAGSVVSSWWNGEGAYIDFTNPEAAAWWQNRLKKLLAETGLDGYKFDAGESSWAPQPSVFHVMDESHPETNLKAYIKACAEFGTNIEVRSGRGTQQYPIFVRMIDRETNWDSRLGLQTLIPTLLQMNILGYPFVLPDMVGGNGYGDKKPSDELFIRWLQANVFMPSIQFSFPPSMFSVEVQRLTTKFVEMHVKYSNKIIEAMENSVKYGTPVNPPLWWIDPTDPTTFHIDSEFLLGEDILIAPVLENGARSRDIYLPKGYWKDEVNENAEIIKGPIWLYNYPADLGTLPFFTKVNAPESHTEHEEKKNSGVSLMPTFTSIFVAIILTKFYSWCFCN